MTQIKKYPKPFVDDFFKQITSLGSYQIYIIISLVFFLLNLYNEFYQLFFGFIIMHLIGIPIRIIFFKDRPQIKKHNNILEKIAASSMPSFHATRIVFLMFFFIFYFENQLSVKIFLSLITLIVLYSRIQRKKHYPIDVIVGILLGTLTWFIINLIF